MALLAGDLIDKARDFDAMFAESAVPKKMTLRELNRLVRSIYQRVTYLSESAFATEISLSLADVETALTDNVGYDLGEFIQILDGPTVNVGSSGSVLPNGKWPIELVSHVDKLNFRSWHGAYLLGSVLHFVDRRDFGSNAHGWEGLDTVTLTYVPYPLPLDDLDDEVALPDICENALVYSLARFMAARTKQDTGWLDRTANEEMQLAVETIAQRDANFTFRVKNY